MVNEEHLAVLRSGVKEWNQWREERDEVILDFRECDLSEGNLRRANLMCVSFARANLNQADLSAAYLRRAYLYDTGLSGATLCQANLILADLRAADLSGADLRGADLRWANLGGADLSDADLSNAVLGETVFGNADLSTVQGLDSCRHSGPSVIDYGTLERSGDLPLAFLRGCGLPDAFIDYLPSILGAPIEYYSCFVSYSSHNQEFAERIHADLQNNGVRCWFAPEDLKIGDPVRDTIDEAIRLRDKLVLVLSEASIDSDWVEHEVTALDEETTRGSLVLFPIRIDDAVMDASLGWAKRIRDATKPTGRHIGDFTNWKDHDSYKQAFDGLLRDLKKTRE